VSEILIYQTEDGQTSLDVRTGDETVWLTQAQMDELFQRDQFVIARHLKNIDDERELELESTMQKMHSARYRAISDRLQLKVKECLDGLEA